MIKKSSDIIDYTNLDLIDSKETLLDKANLKHQLEIALLNDPGFLNLVGDIDDILYELENAGRVSTYSPRLQVMTENDLFVTFRYNNRVKLTAAFRFDDSQLKMVLKTLCQH